jgi:uncharacterized protein with PQ loop repeat
MVDNRNEFIKALKKYHLNILELQDIDITKPDNGPISNEINNYYKYYIDNNDDKIVLSEPSNYSKKSTKLVKEKRDKIIEDNYEIKKIIEEYIDKNIKPTNNQNTKTLKFEVPNVNTKIEDDKELYYKYQYLLKQESSTIKIGMNAENWGYFGIITNGLSALFQMYTLYKTKSAKSFSMPFIWIMTFLNAVYCLVGILEKNIGLAVATFFFVVYNLTVIYVYYKYN